MYFVFRELPKSSDTKSFPGAVFRFSVNLYPIFMLFHEFKLSQHNLLTMFHAVNFSQQMTVCYWKSHSLTVKETPHTIVHHKEGATMAV